MEKDQQILVQEFENVLKELTFNSRPIITTLTKMAEENISCAKYFVESLETRIDKCVPTQKLFAFYALDSICKNAGSPYTIFFSKNLFQLYKKTYLIVDNNTRTKLISLFKSWLQPTKNTGEPVFERITLDVIEKFLIKASALHQKNFESMLPTPTIPLLMKEIDKLLSLTQDRLKNLPNDTKLLTKLEVLAQLKDVLRKEKLSLNALKQVQLQLKQVFAQDQQYLQEKYRRQEQLLLQQQQSQSQQQQLEERKRLLQIPNDNKSPSKSGTPLVPLFSNNNNNSNDFNSSISSNNNNANQPSFSTLFGNSNTTGINTQNFMELERTNKSNKIQSLYDSLNENNLLYIPKRESILTLYDKLNNENNSNDLNVLQNNLPSISTLNNILFDCKAFFAINNVSLNNAPTLQLNQQNIISDNRLVNNHFIHYLYRGKPNKCSACGKRFGNSIEEKNLLTDHLDWHFRINKRIKGSSSINTNNTNSLISESHVGSTTTQKNIQSRNWYLPDSQWSQFKDDEIISTRNTMDKNSNNNTNNFKENKRKTEGNSKRQKHNKSDNYSKDEAVNIENNNDEPEVGNIGNTTDESSLRTQYIVVPDSSVDTTYRCPICQEEVTSSYDDETGEWIWKNTIEIDGKYVHATCHHETIKNKI